MERALNSQACWFAARTRCGSELRVRERLYKLGTEVFLPTELRRHTRGRSLFEHPLIPGLLFLHTTKQQACALQNEYGLPVRYLLDPATRTLLVVPDKQMDDFRRVLDLSDGPEAMCGRPIGLGDYVRVTKGLLCGVEGRVLELRGQTYVVVELCNCIFAKAGVPRSWLELIDAPGGVNAILS